MEYAYRFDLNDLQPAYCDFVYALVVLDIQNQQIFFPRYNEHHHLWKGHDYYERRGYIVLTTLTWTEREGWSVYGA